MPPLPIRRVTRDNDTYQVLRALKENRRKRSELGEAFVEGIEAAKQALAAGWPVRRVLSADFAALSGWAKGLVASLPGAELLQLENGLYQALSDKEDPAELMLTVALRRRGLDDFALPPGGLALIFDRPSDHGNLGSVVRSANAFGADALLVLGHAVDPFEPKVIRSSLGAIFHTPVVQVESMAALETWLAAQRAAQPDFKLFGSDSGGDLALGGGGLRRPCALALGNEAKGMSVALRALVDGVAAIPMSGRVNSLNVACAASILLWQIQVDSGLAGGRQGQPAPPRP